MCGQETSLSCLRSSFESSTYWGRPDIAGLEDANVHILLSALDSGSYCGVSSAMQKHTGFMETPEPFVAAREKPVVSFRAAELQPHATASISVVEGTPIKAVISPQHWQQLKDVLQWRNPAVSALAFLLGTFVALAVEFVLRGDHKMTPLKGVLSACPACRAAALIYASEHDSMLLHATQPCHMRCWRTWRSTSCAAWCPAAGTAARRGPAATSPGRQQRARSRRVTLLHALPMSFLKRNLHRAGVSASMQAVLRLAQWHDTFLSARNPAFTLRIAAALCALSLLSSIFRCAPGMHAFQSL